MAQPPEDKDEAISRLMSALADLSGEQEALAALRREADAFDPGASAESIARALLALKTEGRAP
jgi:hypothetical protein